MERTNQPSLQSISPSQTASISASPAPFHQSDFPFRHVPSQQDLHLNEKATPLMDIAGLQQPSSGAQSPPHPLHAANHLTTHNHINRGVGSSHTSPLSTSQFLRQPAPLLAPNLRSLSHGPVYTRPRGLRIANLLRSWLPLILYAFTSLAFVLAIALYRDQVFARLDELSHWLQADESFGHAVLFVLIFLTTFPPIPLYSTLITLSGYTFGPWTGAIISYFAALSGALTVFIISRGLLRETISRWLASTCTIKRVVRAIEKRPKLLFLVRLAPYPYNVMNCLLAASPTLTLRTYTICTALSLFKVIIHTSLGASIHSFKDYHNSDPDDDDMAARLWTVLGILLCVAIFIYLSIVARRAVDEELDDDVITSHDSEEIMAFLSPEGARGDERGPPGRGRLMAESPFRTQQLMPFRPSAEPEGNGWS